MSKRKAADDHNPDGTAGAKKPRTAGTGAAQAHPPDGTGSIKSVRARPDLVPRIVMRTLLLVDAVKATNSSYMQRTQTVVDLLQADADRSESLIDLSLVVEGETDSLGDDDADDVKADKAAANRLIRNEVLSLFQKLLSSFDPPTVDAATGNNALHEMCGLISPHRDSGWPIKLAKMLISRGVNVSARNKEGYTPLLQCAANCDRWQDSAEGLRLLLAHGADLNAQDGDGSGLLHLLVERKAADMLEDLFDSDGAGPLDFTLRNSAGQTASDLAASKLAQQADSGADSPERRIHRLVATQTALWMKHAQPSPPKGVLQQAGASAAVSRVSLRPALDSAKLVPRIAVQTLRLVDAIQATDGSYTQRMQSVVDLLAQDADRFESLIDLSLVPEGDELLRFFRSFCEEHADVADVKADKRAARTVICKAVLPLVPKLLRSFDPATADAATGNNALHEMCRLFCLHNVSVWDYELAELLIAHGVSVHARNKKGCTPLLQWAVSSVRDYAASGLWLLLAQGADLNAQDGDGNGLLHHLVRCKAEARLVELFGGDGVEHAEHTLRNSAGQTAADLAAIRLAQLADSSTASPEKRIHGLMMAQAALWTTHTRPVLLRCLESVLPVTDLAKLALGYIDGSGLPFASVAEAESDEEAEPAEAAAASQS